MSKGLRAAREVVGSLAERRSRLFTGMAWSTVGAAVVVMALFIALGRIGEPSLTRTLVPIAAWMVVLALFCLWLERRVQTTWAIAAYLTGVTVTVLGVMYFVLGTSGPPVVILSVVPVVAALLGGRRLGQIWSAIVGTLYVSILVLEMLEFLNPATMSGIPVKVMSGAFVVLALVLLSYVVGLFIDQGETALAAANEQGRELARMSSEAERVANAERESREREAESVLNLRQAVREYADFLQRVSAGDYDARLDVNVEDVESVPDEGLRELRALAVHLNATVESLVSALQAMQIIQRRYVGEAWREFTQDSEGGAVFTYSGESAVQASALGLDGRSAEEKWRALEEKSLRSGEPQVDDGLLALPIVWSGQLVGVIGGRRGSGAPWRQEEVALARTVIDQLAQTMENLRLVDQTQRTAQRERMLGLVTARIRASLDVETMIRSAADEMQRSLGLERVAVHLATADKATEAQAVD